jgi:hypothetical protein
MDRSERCSQEVIGARRRPKLPVEDLARLVEHRVSGIDFQDWLDRLVPAVVPRVGLLGQRLRRIDRDQVLSWHSASSGG